MGIGLRFYCLPHVSSFLSFFLSIYMLRLVRQGLLFSSAFVLAIYPKSMGWRFGGSLLSNMFDDTDEQEGNGLSVVLFICKVVD